MALQQDLLKIERTLWTGGPEAYRAATDDPCLVVFSEMTGLMSRDDIARTAEAGRWRDVALEPKGFVQMGDDAAVVSYECAATRKDGEPHRALVSSGYVRRHEGWKLAFHQQTPLR